MLSPAPRIILTSGEPAGIGPDLCIALAQKQWPCDLIVAADRRVIGARARQLGAAIEIQDYDPQCRAMPSEVGMLKIANVSTSAMVEPGKLDARNAQAVLQMLNLAAEGCLDGEFQAMVTAPVQKSIINDAGVPFSGHTEFLAERCGAPLPVMMLVAGSLRVALATTHLPLNAVSQAITAPLLEQVIMILHTDLKEKFGIAAPNILVCGLNPHAGESGHLGREEIDVIAPTLQRLREQGLRIVGPAPADTAFTPRMLENTDAVLAMYHDQGLPVLKFAGFGTAVNVTLGLPIIRTSVDHGTALDLAGTGHAEAGSLEAALRLAIEMAEGRDLRLETRD